MMKREFDVIIERDDAVFYVATVPRLRGYHSQAKSLDQLMGIIRESIALCLEVEEEPDGATAFVGIQRVTVDRSAGCPECAAGN